MHEYRLQFLLLQEQQTASKYKYLAHKSMKIEVGFERLGRRHSDLRIRANDKELLESLC
jgi:hypothetical protein